MTAPTDITSTIATNASGPASASNKTESASAHDPASLIDVDKYLRDRAAADASAAVSNPFGPMQFVQLQLPGACR